MTAVHINRPSSTQFQVMVRLPGARKWQLIGKPTGDYATAIMRMARAFSAGHYKRGMVVVFADYYDPTPCCEMHQ